MNDSFVVSLLESLISSGGWAGTVLAVLVLGFGLFLAGTAVRMILGKGSDVSRAVAGGLTVILVYLTQATAVRNLPELTASLGPLPFCSISHEGMSLLPLAGLPETGLFGGLVKLWFLCFLVDLLETFLPEGKKFLGWLLWRLIAVTLTLSVYGFLTALITAGYPELFGTMAKTVLAVCWGLVLLIGLVKALLEVIQSSANPVIKFVHRFFYQNPFGKLFPMSILTTVVLLLVLALLNSLEMTFVSFGFWTYLPVVAILLAFLYLFSRFL